MLRLGFTENECGHSAPIYRHFSTMLNDDNDDDALQIDV